MMTTTTFVSGCLVIPLVGAAGVAGGEMAAVANPEGAPLIIQDVKLFVDAPTVTADCTLDVGLAANATTSDSDMISALAIDGAIAGKAYHGMTALAGEGEAQVWGTTQYLTATGSDDSEGFAGRLFVQYIRVE